MLIHPFPSTLADSVATWGPSLSGSHRLGPQFPSKRLIFLDLTSLLATFDRSGRAGRLVPLGLHPRGLATTRNPASRSDAEGFESLRF